MKPAYWYYALIFISLGLMILSVARKKDLKLLILPLVITGIIHPFEVFVLFVLPGYRYMPQILPIPCFDSAAGAVISDLFVIPASAVFISAFSLSWRGIVAFAALFTGIDWLFEHLGIYEHYWWRSIYTGINLLILYPASRWIWQRLRRDSHSLFFRLAVIYLSFAAVHTLVHFIPVAILQIYRFHIGWLPDSLREHFLIASVYGYTLGVIVTLSLGLKISFRSRVLIIIMLAVYNWLLGRFGILVPLAGLSTVYYTLIVVISAIILVYLFRLAKMDIFMKNI